jgi:predicted AAA+ superfamily ATPase
MTGQYLPMRERRALSHIELLMQDSPVVLLEGPRSVGKSTLLRQVALSRSGDVVDLDDPSIQEAVRADPSRAVAGRQLVCIDEYQKAPMVLEAIKTELNKGAVPGSFVLTGSARHDSLPPAAQALTGRLTTLPVYPLSQGEQGGTHENFLEVALTEPSAVVTANLSSTTLEDYVGRICRGGFPLALGSTSDAARRRWLRDYIKLTLERDVRELSNLRQGAKLSDLLGRLAGQTAQVLNIDKAAVAVKLHPVTAESYLSLLEKVFLLYRLGSWGKTLIARSVAKPKLHVLDSGVAAVLLRLTPEKLASLDATASSEFGHLVETFAVGELRKQASWLDGVAGIGHWRSYEGAEVDLVVERDDGGIVGFEIKKGSRVPGDELKGLRALRDAVGNNFVGGFAMHLGERSYTYEDRIHVAPLDMLWTHFP